MSAYALMGLAMASCTTKNPLLVKVSHCPSVAVMGDMGSYTRIKGDSNLASDVLYTATVSNVVVDCEDKSQVKTAVTFDVSALAGPAMKDRSVTIDYFVVTAKDTSSLVNKQTYSVTLTFDSKGRAGKNQTILHEIPNIDRARRYDYELIIGLVATPTEYYRNIRR